ncbi:hypothetical protein GQ457_04G022270 [Hibiscus cannabinus]
MPILPPPLKRPPERPHKSRRKEDDEPAIASRKLSRKYVKLKCTSVANLVITSELAREKWVGIKEMF